MQNLKKITKKEVANLSEFELLIFLDSLSKIYTEKMEEAKKLYLELKPRTNETEDCYTTIKFKSFEELKSFYLNLEQRVIIEHNLNVITLFVEELTGVDTFNYNPLSTMTREEYSKKQEVNLRVLLELQNSIPKDILNKIINE